MTHPLDTARSIPEAFFSNTARDPHACVYMQAMIPPGNLEGARTWKAATAAAVEDRIRNVAGFLQQQNIAAGETVAILANTRPEWLECDIGILAAGGVVASVYHSLTAEEVGYILFDAGARIVVAENQEQVDKLLYLLGHDCSIPATEDRAACSVRLDMRCIIAIEAVTPHEKITQLSDIYSGSFSFNDSALTKLTRQSTACLVYTSGTSGPPKGVVQSHGNHLANVRQALECGLVPHGGSLMLFLPLAHSFAKLMGYLAFLADPEVKFPCVSSQKSSKQDMDSVTRDIREAGANVVPVVPRILEKMQGVLLRRKSAPGLQGFILRAAMWAADKVYREKTKLPGDNYYAGVLSHMIYGGTGEVRKKIKRAIFGEHFNYAVSGGAKLNPEVNKFFEALEIEILQGYGLTETCVATNVNRTGSNRIGTVGRVLSPDIELKIAEDGEILFRGPNITSGYHNRPSATKASWDNEGWFHTGDLGSVDSDGYLSITGRKKDLIVTSYGKKISPEAVEDRLKSSPYISQAVVYGDDAPFCVALLTLERDSIVKWAGEKNLILNEALHDDARVKKLISLEVDIANAALAAYEKIRKFEIMPEEFTIENGFLTPTLKVKRKLVIEKFKARIDALYR